MKVAVIGSEGFVGGAMMNAFRHPKADVTPMGIDVKLPETEKNYELLGDVDIIFICVPTPYDPVKEGFDYTAIHEVLVNLNPILGGAEHKAVICLRSTVTPDFFDIDLANMVHIIHPEFLCAKTACKDFLNPDIHIAGAHDPEKLQVLFKMYALCKIEAKLYMECTPKEAVYLKLIHNVYRAQRISFLNELYVTITGSGGSSAWKSLHPLLCDTFAVRGFGGTYLDVPGPDGRFGFGGACFPKDVAAFLGWLKKNGHPHEIMKAVQTVNTRMRIPT